MSDYLIFSIGYVLGNITAILIIILVLIRSDKNE